MAMLLCTIAWILEWGHCPHSCQRMGESAPTAPMVPPPMHMDMVCVGGVDGVAIAKSSSLF